MFAEGNYRRRKRMRRHAYKSGLGHHGGFGFKAAAVAAAAASWPSSMHAAAAAAMSTADIYGCAHPYNFAHYASR